MHAHGRDQPQHGLGTKTGWAKQQERRRGLGALGSFAQVAQVGLPLQGTVVRLVEQDIAMLFGKCDLSVPVQGLFAVAEGDGPACIRWSSNIDVCRYQATQYHGWVLVQINHQLNVRPPQREVNAWFI